MYHDVTEQPEGDKKIRNIDPEYSLSVSQFEEQIAFLHARGYKSITLQDLPGDLEEGGRRCLITFDDGYIGNYTHAYPILKKYGFTAVFFVIPMYIGSAEYWMSWQQLREMAAEGFSIQSHTWSHPALESVDEDSIQYELTESKKVIEREVGIPVDCLSLPFGSQKKEVFEIARQSGFATVMTSSLSMIRKASQPLVVGRIPVKSSYSMHTFEKLVTREKRIHFHLQWAERIKGLIKKGIGINNYRAIYRRVKGIRQ
jgi:peptidoglycan/xylan/chitin deacetylase (PgdA/CDA1 family)